MEQTSSGEVILQKRQKYEPSRMYLNPFCSVICSAAQPDLQYVQLRSLKLYNIENAHFLVLTMSCSYSLMFNRFIPEVSRVH